MMNRQDFMKQQNCVLKVNIQCACDGCEHKVKKTLNKIHGVHKTSIDLEQGKVTVYGNADPATLIKKLNKSGKHAELWGPQKGVNFINNQFKNMGFDNKNQNGAGGKGHQQMQPTKGFKDFKPSNNNKKSVKFNLPAGGGGHHGRFGGEDVFDDDDDEFDDEFDDGDDDSFDGHDHKKPNKMTVGPGLGGYGPGGPLGMMMNEKNGSSGRFELPVQIKGKGGSYNGKNGNGGKKGGRGGENEGGKMSKGSSGGGGLFRFFGGNKKKQDGSNPKGGKKGGDRGASGHMKYDSWNKKRGKHQDEVRFGNNNKQNEFLEFSKPQKAGGGRNFGHNGGNVGQNMSQMGGNPMMAQIGNHPMHQMGGYPMGQMPMTQMRYRGQGMDQQQYMSSMMMNQYKANMYPPQMMYGMAPPAAYGPPMGAHENDNMTHMFSDENTDSCSIM